MLLAFPHLNELPPGQAVLAREHRDYTYCKKRAVWVHNRFSQRQKHLIAKRQRGRCANPDGVCMYREKKRAKHYDREWNHRKPLRRGGKNCVSNGQMLCRHCHAYKTFTERNRGCASART